MAARGVEIAFRDTGAAAPGELLGWDDPGALPPEISSKADEWHGVPVVLLHGLSGDGRGWTDFARRLAVAGRRAIVPDLRGHGHSGRADDYTFAAFRDDILDLLDELGVEHADLVGHSLGGHVASMVAQERPKLVRRLVIEESPPPPRNEDEAMPFADRARRPRVRMSAWAVLRSVPTLLRFDQRALGHVAPAYRTPTPDWWAALPDITAETLILYGGPTGPVPADRLAAQAEAIPDCRVVTFDDAGHRIHSTRPDDFAAAVLGFLTA
ncbi:alpha/beta hydrolase [Phytomonospora endophytica]|nr:alpha/beta hydrolase [Phytomonospora endophytica]